MDNTLLEKIEVALEIISPMAAQNWPPAQSIERQLLWCRALALGSSSELRPGPFSMGLIATREFDMWSDQPELAALINEIQRLAEIRVQSA